MTVRVQYTKPNGCRAEAKVTPEAAKALRERPDLQGPAARRDFILQHIAPPPTGYPPRPTSDAVTETQPRPGDQWNCGNRHLSSQAALILVAENRIADFEAMQWLEGALDEAGPEFCNHVANNVLSGKIPF